VRFIDGDGRLLRLGGKVVKNAAGFDLPKFFVGSLGRFGVLAELTFKVFPQAATSTTLRLSAKDAAAKAVILSEAGRERWELDALESSVAEDAVYARLAGPAAALDVITAEILARWPGTSLAPSDAADLWQSISEFSWAHEGGVLMKVVLSPSEVLEFSEYVRTLGASRGWIGSGGNVGYLSMPARTALPALRWPALTLRGQAALWPGATPRFEIMRAIKTALDPKNRFPGLDE
jgi:glycolate oxidase FAD binding subunit